MACSFRHTRCLSRLEIFPAAVSILLPPSHLALDAEIWLEVRTGLLQQVLDPPSST